MFFYQLKFNIYIIVTPSSNVISLFQLGRISYLSHGFIISLSLQCLAPHSTFNLYPVFSSKISITSFNVNTLPVQIAYFLCSPYSISFKNSIAFINPYTLRFYYLQKNPSTHLLIFLLYHCHHKNQIILMIYT